VNDFVQEYARGRTPIPCVRCNTFTKFRDLVHKADAIDARWVATGHYARVSNGALFRGLDPAKDQSYFLWGINRGVLSRLILPVGSRTKQETRDAARALGIGLVASKVESQDICFVPDGNHVGVMRRILGDDAPSLSSGPFVLCDGTVVGAHEGHAGFTIGQRRGLPGGFPEPMFVVDIRQESRAVVIGTREELLGSGLVAREVNWLDDPPVVGADVEVQVRHRAHAVPGTLIRIDAAEIEIALDEPIAAITPGQSVVLYSGDRVLGGGVIEASRRVRAGLPVRAA
jgi:tRNA-specific 2-thiouridylase